MTTEKLMSKEAQNERRKTGYLDSCQKRDSEWRCLCTIGKVENILTLCLSV